MERQNLILGMPGTGKTTYLAAMTYMLLSNEITTKLRWSQFDEVESHLYALQNKWLRYEKLDHTPTGGENWVSLHMSVAGSDAPVKIQLPDFSGESLKNAVVTGYYTDELCETLKASSGIFLFTNADSKQTDILINDMGTILSGISDLPSQISQFDPMEMPEQVKVVQLLQSIVALRSNTRKLVVMISAWDVVERSNGEITPESWLEGNRPLLHQYLRLNEPLWNSRVYGVSAQGGRLPADKDMLNKIQLASERVKLVGPNLSANDLTEPLHWLTSVEDA